MDDLGFRGITHCRTQHLQQTVTAFIVRTTSNFSASAVRANVDDIIFYPDSVLFLTWHRPYLALYEQVLVSYAQSLVQTYDVSVRAKYQAAADALRLVYWDWATIPTMPEVVEQPNLTITTGSGPQSVTNPFYQYKFKNFPLDPKLFPNDPNVAGDWWLANYNTTVRGATSIGDASNPDLVNSYLAGSDLMKNTVTCPQLSFMVV